jgi:hypothetical protein
MADEPNQGATGAASAEGATGATTAEAGVAGARTPGDGPAAVNQGAPGARPLGETPLSVDSESDAFAERPEAFVGAAFAGGLALALILRRLAK